MNGAESRPLSPGSHISSNAVQLSEAPAEISGLSAVNGADERLTTTTSGQPGSQTTPKDMYSIHGEQAAKRRAIAELIFFAGVNDLRRCKQIAMTWNVKVKEPAVMDYDRRTPLHVAAAEGAYSVVEWLVQEGADVNAIDRHGRTPLEEAARNDHGEVVRLLIQFGGNVFEENKLVALDKSKLRGIVNTRRMMMTELGWEPEWEVNPKELQLVERIGSGEFGDVYKAKWHGSYVAAKLLKRSDEIAIGDFRTEIAILRKIHHPNCTQFLGACTKQKPYIVITELMSCSLADAFQRTFYTPSVRRQVEIALDFARGMAYLHSRRQPIVHRDLKPANLMIAGNLHADTEQLYLDSGVIKVADFGLSKSLVPVERHGGLAGALDINVTYKLTGETGSYRYMAPECFRHEPYNLKVDVYSFAMIIFQLFEATQPFSGHDPVEAARNAAMLSARPGFPPRSKLSSTEVAMRRLIEDCWAADAEKRPTFEEIIQRLEIELAKMPKHQHFEKDAACTSCIVQ
ncbi:hypothetical protein Vretimale_4568 [Volvox reticuliferus]|uniref:Protein kinase domain-containing protein n=2 Tax=Volvox reticuliferus TaxID=1737510 RepID=A0A8J4C481_9CHLO|nr:hypothetical protein Vretifemale_3063 [Volvox reticuliferus]GIL99401.1 hypothetical protein Vretimale_4568 [Volvox reticuliferus]